MTVVIIVQARMTSTRLPGKVLLPVLGRPLLAHQLDRLQTVPARLVVATTHRPTDDPVVALCESRNVTVYRGPEEDVLARFTGALQPEDAVVVRITADCPLIDPDIVTAAIAQFQATDVDYQGHNGLPRGLDVEVMRRDALETAHRQALHPDEREHVTPFLYWRPERFRLGVFAHQPDLSQHRWTVDTPEDFALVSRIIQALIPQNPQFRLKEILALLDEHPDWLALNAGIQQKTLGGRNPHTGF
jgi:spore coat polysaccharide biosynthesis protein SpsF